MAGDATAVGGMSRRGRTLGFGFAVVLALAGTAGAIAFSGTFGQVLALILVGLGFVLATGLVFLEVGLSEDRERAREEDRKARAAESPRARPRRPRLQRMRGSRRRLR